jgi:hypothetical protein
LKHSKIYIGPANTSNIFKELQVCLRSIGLNADFIPWSTNHHEFYKKNNREFKLIDPPPFKFFGKNIFYFINVWFLKPLYFIFVLIKYDTFFFIKPVTFFKKNKDLPILKLMNKKIVFFYVGCNDRNPLFSNDPTYICNLCNNLTLQKRNHCHNLIIKKEKSLFFEKYATKIFGVDDLVDFNQKPTSLAVIPAGEIKISFNLKDYNKKLKILHLPSNPLVKGTNFIEPVLERIKEEEDVEIIIKKENWPQEKMINTLKEGHILIDSLAAYTFGKLSLEAIQYGCVPLNAYPDWIAKYYDIPPVVKVNKDTLYSILKELIHDRELLKKYAERSQNAFNQYFTYQAAGEYYKNQLNLN